jgi:hypothetical protein
VTRSWGPVEKPVEHDVKPIAGDGGEGEVVTSEPGDRHHAPVTARDRYNATDGRHNRADHEGWESVDPRSGTGAEDDFHATGKFEDGPSVWRQT